MTFVEVTGAKLEGGLFGPPILNRVKIVEGCRPINLIRSKYVQGTLLTQAASMCSKSTNETINPYEICSNLTIKKPERPQ